MATPPLPLFSDDDYFVGQYADFVVAGPSRTKHLGKKRRSRGWSLVDYSDDDISEPEQEVPRYLLVSNGCAIFVLELKPNESSDVARAIPKQGILDLIEEKLPVSVGLFRFGPDLYIFGGHMFDTAVDTLYPPLFMIQRNTDFPPSNIARYRSQLLTRFLKGTSCGAYRLTLEEDYKTLSYSSGCKHLEMNSPKFWPIAEEIDGQIHVFDTNPWMAKPDGSWKFTHEVLGRYGWSKIVTSNLDMQHHFISRHLVVGHQIYAIAGRKCLLFDSKKSRWEEVDYKRDNEWDLCRSRANCVWDILLMHGFAYNVGEIGLEDDRLSIILEFYSCNSHTSAIAYLVSPKMGKIVCRQFLRDFFPAEAPISPCAIISATRVIETAQDWDKKTMCVVLNAHVPFDEENTYHDSYLFVYIFTLKEISGAVKELKAKQSSVWEFVCAAVKDSYIFKSDSEFNDQKPVYEWCYMDCIQACFIEGEQTLKSDQYWSVSKKPV